MPKWAFLTVYSVHVFVQGGSNRASFGVSTTPKEGSIWRLWTPRKNDRAFGFLLFSGLSSPFLPTSSPLFFSVFPVLFLFYLIGKNTVFWKPFNKKRGENMKTNAKNQRSLRFPNLL